MKKAFLKFLLPFRTTKLQQASLGKNLISECFYDDHFSLKTLMAKIMILLQHSLQTDMQFAVFHFFRSCISRDNEKNI